MKLSHWEPDLRTLFNWIENGEIDLQPNFQRGDVWPIQKKRKLIDTILREWSIPPVHMVVTSSGTLEVLDGQQRLTAIRDFMRDDFSIDGEIEPIDDQLARLNKLRYSQLPTQVRRSFDQYTLRVFRITEYEPEEPGELFYRLNQQITLTAGEQRNAIFGPAREQLKQTVLQFESRGNERETIGFSNARLAYDDVFAKLLFFIEIRSFAEKATETKISDRFKLQEPFSNSTLRKTRRAIEHFSKARERAQRAKLNKASLLSWLLFYCRFEDAEPNVAYLTFFEHAKSKQGDHQYLQKELNIHLAEEGDYFERSALSLFVDRSSLRVSDVSSVAYRDFVLWAIYVTKQYGEVPAGVNRKQINRISRSFSGVKTSLELLLDEELDIQDWARL